MVYRYIAASVELYNACMDVIYYYTKRKTYIFG
jgi:hypothetical protein